MGAISVPLQQLITWLTLFHHPACFIFKKNVQVLLA
jgi:hypothetical protein